ncbi:MAG: carbohydrate transporter ATP-binding protein family, partial [Thermoleophilia bacterium]|nr:carbohydrate transporter ATP-binding protein family [Thermoleophilia bacterium]
REPQAFLMDEPLSNLDAKLRVQMRTEIAKLHQRLQTTTVYVTHDQVEALTLGQRICILRKGVIQQVNTPYEVYQNPSNVFVGGFIGSPGMNFMSGHLVLHHGVVFLQLGEHHLPLPASLTSRLLATSTVHGRPVVVGIRPEHFSLATDGDPYTLPVNVELVEAMGSEAYAYFSTNVAVPDLSELSDTQAMADSFVARLGAGSSVRGGERIHLRPHLDEIHLFDPQTMLTLLSPADEGEVRARQTAAAGISIPNAAPHSHVAAPTALATMPSAAPLADPVRPAAPAAAATVLQPMQPVIHLHQTFVRPDMPQVGVLDAAPATMTSVFESQVAAPVPLEPLHGMPAPRRVATEGSHPRPNFAATIVGNAPPSPLATPPLAPSPSAPPRLAPQAAAQPAPPIAAPPAVAPDAAAPAPASPDAPALARAHEATPPPAPPAPTPPRGFAPRAIGAPSGRPTVSVESTTASPVGDTVRLDVVASELDVALEASTPEATLAMPARAPAIAGSGFREALARMRQDGPATPVDAAPAAPVTSNDFRRLRFGGPPEPPAN